VAKIGPLQVKTVHGEPIHVDERVLIPVVRVVSFGQARATIGGTGYGGWGTGFVRVQPVAVLEETPHGRRRIRIAGGTSVAVRRLVWLVVGISVGLAALRGLVRRVEQ
jgi:uncharacterized spore protein YtfJ